MKEEGGTNVSAAVLSTHVMSIFFKSEMEGGGAIPTNFPGLDASEVMETFLFQMKLVLMESVLTIFFIRGDLMANFMQTD